jgi:hypothetical protein
MFIYARERLFAQSGTKWPVVAATLAFSRARTHAHMAEIIQLKGFPFSNCIPSHPVNMRVRVCAREFLRKLL